jgi:hypothetical protein
VPGFDDEPFACSKDTDFFALRQELDRRDLVLAQDSFYNGARGILKVQSFLLERGRYDELHAMVEMHGRQIDNLIRPGRRQRH